jgi:hypothetical protein
LRALPNTRNKPVAGKNVITRTRHRLYYISVRRVFSLRKEGGIAGKNTGCNMANKTRTHSPLSLKKTPGAGI